MKRLIALCALLMTAGVVFAADYVGGERQEGTLDDALSEGPTTTRSMTVGGLTNTGITILQGNTDIGGTLNMSSGTVSQVANITDTNGLEYVPDFIGFEATQTNNITVNNATFTAINYQQEIYDPLDIWDNVAFEAKFPRIGYWDASFGFRLDDIADGKVVISAVNTGVVTDLEFATQGTFSMNNSWDYQQVSHLKFHVSDTNQLYFFVIYHEQGSSRTLTAATFYSRIICKFIGAKP